jgi:hypothetical protein
MTYSRAPTAVRKMNSSPSTTTAASAVCQGMPSAPMTVKAKKAFERPIRVERHHEDGDGGRQYRDDGEHLLDFTRCVPLDCDARFPVLTGEHRHNRRVHHHDVTHRQEGGDASDDLCPEVGVVLLEAEKFSEPSHVTWLGYRRHRS